MLPAFVILLIDCCVALLCVLFAIQQLRNKVKLHSKGCHPAGVYTPNNSLKSSKLIWRIDSFGMTNIKAELYSFSRLTNLLTII